MALASLGKNIIDKLMAKNRNIALFVDGPNILRKEFQIDLDLVKSRLQNKGNLKIAKVYINQFATQKLIEAIINKGFDPIVTVTDVDVAMAVDSTEAIFNQSVNTICLVTRDADFLPVITKAKKYGKDVIVMLVDDSASVSLKNTADELIILKRVKGV